MSDKGPLTSVQILGKLNVRPSWRWVHDEKYAWGIIRQQLIQRADGLSGLLVDPRCDLIVAGFEGELHYPPHREGRRASEAPEETHPYIDIFDALKYVCLGRLDIRQPDIARPADRYIAPREYSTTSYMGM